MARAQNLLRINPVMMSLVTATRLNLALMRVMMMRTGVSRHISPRHDIFSWKHLLTVTVLFEGQLLIFLIILVVPLMLLLVLVFLLPQEQDRLREKLLIGRGVIILVLSLTGGLGLGWDAAAGSHTCLLVAYGRVASILGRATLFIELELRSCFPLGDLRNVESGRGVPLVELSGFGEVA